MQSSLSTDMAGHRKNALLAPAGKRREQNTQMKKRTAKRKFNSKMIIELVEEAKLYSIDEDVVCLSVIEALEMVLDRSTSLFRLAQMQVDKLTTEEIWVEKVDAQGNILVEPNKWIQWEATLREEVFEMAARMQSLNIDERRAHIEEVQTDMLTKALLAAAVAAGLNEAQQKTLGVQLRVQLAELQATVLTKDSNSGEYTRKMQSERKLPPPPYLEGNAVDATNAVDDTTDQEEAA